MCVTIYIDRVLARWQNGGHFINDIFECNCVFWIMYFDFTDFIPGVQLTTSIGLHNGLAPFRPQAINQINTDMIKWLTGIYMRHVAPMHWYYTRPQYNHAFSVFLMPVHQIRACLYVFCVMKQSKDIEQNLHLRIMISNDCVF